MIQIQFKGKYLIKEIELHDPLVTVVTSTDYHERNEVAVLARFENGYSLVHDTGTFPYETTWEDENVESHINLFMKNCLMK